MELNTLFEREIDKNGLATILDVLATICSEKADHLYTNWQDEKAGKRWDVLAGVIRSAHDRASKFEL
jgi:hypothetical protein